MRSATRKESSVAAERLLARTVGSVITRTATPRARAAPSAATTPRRPSSYISTITRVREDPISCATSRKMLASCQSETASAGPAATGAAFAVVAADGATEQAVRQAARRNIANCAMGEAESYWPSIETQDQPVND